LTNPSIRAGVSNILDELSDVSEVVFNMSSQDPIENNNIIPADITAIPDLNLFFIFVIV
jgi:hypothetical protein